MSQGHHRMLTHILSSPHDAAFFRVGSKHITTSERAASPRMRNRLMDRNTVQGNNPKDKHDDA
jgi:hypothetical protein